MTLEEHYKNALLEILSIKPTPIPINAIDRAEHFQNLLIKAQVIAAGVLNNRTPMLKR